MDESSRGRLQDPLWWLFIAAVLAPFVLRIPELSGGGSASAVLVQAVQDASALALGTSCIMCAARGRGYGRREELSHGERVANAVLGVAFLLAVLVFRLARLFVG